MHQSLFFKMFPPPRFMTMRYVGLDMSGDYISFVQYSPKHGDLRVDRFGSVYVGAEIMEGGDVKNESAFINLLSEFQKKYKLSYVKVSVPEEKAYLFQTEVPSSDMHSIKQNIEFKLEENVPLQAADAVFYFDLLPSCVTGGKSRASVSVVPKSYIEKNLSILRRLGMFPVSFEVVPKAIARSVSGNTLGQAEIIVNLMEHRIGMYIVHGDVVCFSSTVARNDSVGVDIVGLLSKEISRVNAYWQSKCESHSVISRVVIVGKDAERYEKALPGRIEYSDAAVVAPSIWQNAINFEKYIPPISKAESFMYTVAAGLAIPLN